ncbi:MAG TPA: mechanosensitive ion channel [Methanothrix soehngenii]|nr:mechanosensitive ion channel [Methanothrix soehngenii]HPT19350.1 mechanosensitive ion channel [Methanothrix sp.]
MDLTSLTGAADPIFMANWIQHTVDSLTGRHIDLVFIQIMAGAISSIDIPLILVSIIMIILIALFTRKGANIADQMMVRYIPTISRKVQFQMDDTMQLMIRRLVSAAIYTIGLMLIIYQIPQLRSLVTAILAGAGIAGLAIGYAAKDSLSNFTSSIFIAVFQPYRVGDSVDFRGEYGQVEDLTLRHTVIRTTDNKRIIVPNSVMGIEPIVNWSIKEPEILWIVDFDLEKASDIDRAREIIVSKARGHPMVLKDRRMTVQLISSRYSELTLRLEVPVPGRNVAKAIGCDIREAVKKEFEAQGIPPAPTP